MKSIIDFCVSIIQLFVTRNKTHNSGCPDVSSGLLLLSIFLFLPLSLFFGDSLDGNHWLFVCNSYKMKDNYVINFKKINLGQRSKFDRNISKFRFISVKHFLFWFQIVCCCCLDNRVGLLGIGIWYQINVLTFILNVQITLIYNNFILWT